MVGAAGGRLGALVPGARARRALRSVAVLVLVLVGTIAGSAGPNASAQPVNRPSAVAAASSSCTALSGVVLTVGSKVLTAPSGTFVHGYLDDPLYGLGVASATTINSVISSSMAKMSSPAMLSEPGATLTVCAKGSGHITCTNVSGQWRFTPGLLVGSQALDVKTSLAISGCTTSQGASVVFHQHPHSAGANFNAWTNTFTGVQLSCGDFLVGTNYSNATAATTGTVKWNNPMAAPTSFSFSGFSITNPQGTATISLPNSGGSGTTTGAYQGSAEVTFTTTPDFTFGKSGNRCRTVAGVRVMKMDGGTVSFG